MTLFDLASLVAASALAMAALAWLYPDISWPMIADNFSRNLGPMGLALHLMEAVMLLMPAFLVLSAALLALRARRPRPRRWRMIWRQPGSLACLVVGAVTTIVYGVALAGMWRRGELVGPPPWRSVTTEWPLLLTAAAVVVAWTTLALTGRWRAERSWIDRAGRSIGVLVIAGAIPLVVFIFAG